MSKLRLTDISNPSKLADARIRSETHLQTLSPRLVFVYPAIIPVSFFSSAAKMQSTSLCRKPFLSLSLFFFNEVKTDAGN